MARTAKPRRICAIPTINEFNPNCLSKETVVLTIDEFEAIRLVDQLNLTQEEASNQMNVSRTTVQAIYDTARKKLADALVNGKRLIIDGGSFSVCAHSAKCCGKNCTDLKCREHNCHSDSEKNRVCHRKSI